MPSDTRKRAWLGFYLAWLPMTALLVALLATRGGWTWSDAALLGVPLCFVYALVTRSAWYVCRVIPLQRGSLPRLVVSHVAAALLASSGWVFLALGLGRILPLDAPMALDREVPFLLGIGTTYYLLAVVYHYLVLAMAASAEAEQAALQAKSLAREAELKALRAQLNPHFLFNALHSISALTAIDASRARDMTIALSEFLRSSLKLGDRERVVLSDELGLARAYLRVESIRFSDRLRLVQDVAEDCLRCRVPPLILQPLVENAVKHGVAHATEPSRVALTVRRDGARLHLTVENDVEEDVPPSRGTGRGLDIVRERLRAQYGGAARLEAGHPDGDEARYRVRLTLPVDAPSAAPATGEEP